jgi:hypothetical protein
MKMNEILKHVPDVRSQYSKEKQAMYDEIWNEGNETTWDAVDKFYPDKEKMILRAAGDRDRKKKMTKSKSKRKVCRCKK